MRAVTFFFLLWLLGNAGAFSAENNAKSFEIQLVRGTDEAKAREASWKAVSNSLNKKLGSGFRWKNYWEVQRVNLEVAPGKPAKTKLSSDREVEICLLDSGDSEARVYWKGKLLRRCRQATHDPICIMGGTREKEDSWFVVVRRSKSED